MSTGHGHDEPDPVTDRVHENSWSVNLQKPEHAEDREFRLEGAVHAVEHTAADSDVGLVTHDECGHPETYLFAELDAAFGDDVDYESVGRFGCGGHVTGGHVRS